MASNAFDPNNVRLLSIEEMDVMREELGFSMNEFSRRAEVDEDCWRKIVDVHRNPRLDTYLSFLDVLKNADPDGPRTQRGRQASCLVDGGRD